MYTVFCAVKSTAAEMEDPPKTRQESKKKPKDKRADVYSAKHIRLQEARKKNTSSKRV